jgi:hypothetical protein
MQDANVSNDLRQLSPS